MKILIEIPESIVTFCKERKMSDKKIAQLFKRFIEAQHQDDWGNFKDVFTRWLEDEEIELSEYLKNPF